jgi:hypothetical protein
MSRAPSHETHQGYPTMSDTLREALELRAIRVSALAALSKAMPVDVRDGVQDRADELLADLEARVIRDGGNEEVLAAIEATRREIRE